MWRQGFSFIVLFVTHNHRATDGRLRRQTGTNDGTETNQTETEIKCRNKQKNKTRGRQYAQAVQALVELRVGGPPEERLPALGLTFGVRAATQRAHAALLAGAEQVAQRGALAAAFSVKLRGFPPWVAMGISLCIATGNGKFLCAGRVYTAPAIM
ncbi:hypothetical protein EYF80_051074 [Liparis tanakae]|uniref:Uncharacterized protein n=1 Tax=Liparis tanakae TaxID=230148 RepID=A0A4Z2FEC2_9TELE|nr:hypothetical protein EYF80_051074 [Liparis tanakae]